MILIPPWYLTPHLLCGKEVFIQHRIPNVRPLLNVRVHMNPLKFMGEQLDN